MNENSETEWISCVEAVRLLSPFFGRQTTFTICKRAHAGLIKAEADLIILDKTELKKTTVSPNFWWAEGQAALNQDWTAGDFSTYVGDNSFDKKQMRIFGVRFLKKDIDRLVPDSQPIKTKRNDHGRPTSKRVFIVHGRDEGPRAAAASVITALGLEPVILNQQANEGMSVIEKIHKHSDVAFAVVMLTPDDVGHLKGDPPKDRARQNVILELGYFIGKLGRSNVATFMKGDLELPSDWAGVITEMYNDLSPSWKYQLAKELKSAGYEIDMNKVP